MFISGTNNTMKSFVTSLWLVTVGAANLFVATPVTQMFPSNKPGWMPKFSNAADYFTFLTIAMLVVAVVFLFVAKRFNKGQEQAVPV